MSGMTDSEALSEISTVVFNMRPGKDRVTASAAFDHIAARLRGEAAQENVAEDSYHFMADLLAPYVTDTHGGLPGSVVESFQMLLDHWNRTHAMQGEQQAVAEVVQEWDGVNLRFVSEILPAGTKLYTRPQAAPSSTAKPDMPPPGKPFVGCQCPSCGEEFVASAAPAPVAGDAVAAVIADMRSANSSGPEGVYLRVRRWIKELEAALAQDRASQAGAPVGVPDGWRLVPVTLTREMLDSCGTGAEGLKRKLWASMLAAAPQPPAEAQADHQAP